MKSDNLLHNVATGLLVLASVLGVLAREMSSAVKPAEQYKSYFSLTDIELNVGDKAGASTFLGLITYTKTALQFKAEGCYDPITVVPESVYDNTQSLVDDRQLLKLNFAAVDVYQGKIIEPMSPLARTSIFIKNHFTDAILIQRHTINPATLLRIYTSKSCHIDRETTLAVANTALAVIEKLKY